MDRLAERRQAAVLEAIAAAFPAPPIPPEEVALRAELKRRMDEPKAADPDPLGATPAERLAVDPDWLHHTPEGRRVYRRRAQWFGKMRRRREAGREELRRQRVDVVLVPVVHSAHRSTDRRPRAARARRTRRCSSRGSPARQDDSDEADLDRRIRAEVA